MLLRLDEYLLEFEYLTEEDATVSMSTNVILFVRRKTGDSSSESEEMVETLDAEVVADCSKISRETGKSETQFTGFMLGPNQGTECNTARCERY